MNTPRTILLATLASTVLAVSSVHALEKQARLFAEDAHWRGASTCSLVYYNTCTGWIWIWTGWAPSERLGVQYDACADCANPELATTFAYVYSGAPAGYGFTGTLGVYAADASDCPTGSALASTAWLPVAGWNTHAWNVPVPASFAVMMTMGAGLSNPTAFTTDHPAAGPTGPQACGFCYPLGRPNHSYGWGTTGPPCPGIPLNDGVCDAQLLWDAQLNCPIATESSTWGTIKSLYR